MEEGIWGKILSQRKLKPPPTILYTHNKISKKPKLILDNIK